MKMRKKRRGVSDEEEGLRSDDGLHEEEGKEI